MSTIKSGSSVFSVLSRFALVVSTLAIFGISPAARSQNVLEEVIVTAQKREESLQDAPISVSAFTGDQLLRSGVLNTNDLAQMVPNMDIQTETNRDGVVIQIRGIAGTDVRNSADPTTAFHIDGNYVPRLSGANAYFFDVERLEVLRGPQGTLYGRNSTSGVVNVISKKPVLGEFNAEGQVGVGNFQMFDFRGGINIPISENIAARVAVMRHTRDGFTENGGPGSSNVTEDGNDADDLAIRGHLLWEISDDTSLLFTAERYDANGVGQQGALVSFVPESIVSTTIGTNPDGTPNGIVFPPAVVTPAGPTNRPARVNPLNSQGIRDNHDNNFRIEANHSFGFADAYYQAAFRSHNRLYADDNDNTNIVANGIASTDQIVETTHSKSWTQELRFTSNNDGPLQWIVGAFWLREDIGGNFKLTLARDPTRNAGAMIPPPVAMAGFDQQIVQFIDENTTNKSYAFFLNTTYDITERLRFNGGVRWTRDEKDAGGSFTDPMSGSRMIVRFINRGTNGGTPIVFTGVNGAPQVASPSWTKTTYKLGLDWQVTDDIMSYFSFGTGYKSGGYNRGSQGTLGNPELFVFDPEEIDAWEVGLKSTLLEGRARLNLTGFYYDYTDMQQAAIFTNPADGTRTNITFNAAESTIWGIEAEGTLLFGDSGSLTVSAGFIDTKFDEFIGFVDDLTSVPVDISGNELPRTPEFNTTLNLIPMKFQGWRGTWTPEVQFHYESSSFLTPQNRDFQERGSFTKTDFTVEYQHEGGNWYALAFIRNIEDKDVLNTKGCTAAVGSAQAPGRPNPVQNCNGTFEAPRTFGFHLGYRM